ncbi:MAG: hypothetical protein C4326_03960 [Ignavibacteria bacterium]
MASSSNSASWLPSEALCIEGGSLLPERAASLRASLSHRFDLTVQNVCIARTMFRLLKVCDSNVLLERITPEMFAHDERLPYWADLWHSSIELARWCLEEAELGGKRVLELGCGLGLAGIAAATAGAEVTFSDYDADALAFAACNVAANLSPEAQSRIRFFQLDWRHLPSISPFDLIIGADVVYERGSFSALSEALWTLLRSDGYAVLTEPDRTIGRDFFAELDRQKFRLSTVQRPVVWDKRMCMINRVEIRR